MRFEHTAEQVLRDVAQHWSTQGPLDALRQLVAQVWATDVGRHEPRLGDDPLCLGIQASRNICNLAVRQLRSEPDVTARDLRTLEVKFAGRTLHISKAPSSSRTWSVQSIDWAESEVRDLAAKENSAVYQPVDGTLFEGLLRLPTSDRDPNQLKQIHLAWQGFEDGTAKTWLGFPRIGIDPWFAVIALDVGDGGTGGLPVTKPSAPSAPDFDSLSEPAIPLTRRARRAASGEDQAQGI